MEIFTTSPYTLKALLTNLGMAFTQVGNGFTVDTTQAFKHKDDLLFKGKLSKDSYWDVYQIFC